MTGGPVQAAHAAVNAVPGVREYVVAVAAAVAVWMAESGNTREERPQEWGSRGWGARRESGWHPAARAPLRHPTWEMAEFRLARGEKRNEHGMQYTPTENIFVVGWSLASVRGAFLRIMRNTILISVQNFTETHKGQRRSASLQQNQKAEIRNVEHIPR
jgi:hypothetical protein